VPEGPLPLDHTVAGIVGPLGTCVLQDAPDGPSERWYPTAVHVKVSTAVLQGVATVYSGQAATDGYFIDACVDASTGDTTGRIEGHIVARTQDRYVWAVFTGCDVGAQATMRVVGTKGFA
jgi:hypothetical protein